MQEPKFTSAAECCGNSTGVEKVEMLLMATSRFCALAP